MKNFQVREGHEREPACDDLAADLEHLAELHEQVDPREAGGGPAEVVGDPLQVAEVAQRRDDVFAQGNFIEKQEIVGILNQIL